MKLQLNKKKLKNLSKDAQILPSDMTPNIGGGVPEPDTDQCYTDPYFCTRPYPGGGTGDGQGGVSGYDRTCTRTGTG